MRTPPATLIATSLIAVLAVMGLTIAGPDSAASAATGAKTRPPVKLDGKVNNHGKKAVQDNAVTIEQDDLYFEPTFLKAKAGSTVQVTVENGGGAEHTFTIDKQDVDEQLAPGDSVKVDVTIPSNGKPVAFSCRFHVGSGMQGAFYSKGGGAAKRAGDSDGGGYGY